MSESERLNKFIASKGVTSRRKADGLVREARVKVNGQTIHSPGFPVNPQYDIVEIDGKPIDSSEKIGDKHSYIILNKPKGVITTASDEYGRKNVLDIVGSKYRLFPVGRLDKDTEGLLLLTDDGDLAYRLTHPKFKVDKTYDVIVTGRLDGSKVRRGKIRILYRSNSKTRLHITIHEGKKRQIRIMFMYLGYPVMKLKRISIGPLKLGALKTGQSRRLTGEEVKNLNKAVGLG
ncbi:MAG: hypothetical protein AUJ75_03340 [Candidatus Omnitrophica bacterium CG1_02_49_10]|nr:MAG: hypothetical protein AUJ75_03340 [Candidatus Omnitrophica bacterium CG1_02_49_10]